MHFDMFIALLQSESAAYKCLFPVYTIWLKILRIAVLISYPTRIQGAFQNKRDFCHKHFLMAPSVNEVVR